MPSLEVVSSEIKPEPKFSLKPVDDNCLFCKEQVLLQDRHELMYSQADNGMKRVCDVCLLQKFKRL